MIRDLIRGPVRDPIRGPVRDPVRGPVRDPVRDPVRGPVQVLSTPYETYETSSHNQNVQVQYVYHCCLCLIFDQGTFKL